MLLNGAECSSCRPGGSVLLMGVVKTLEVEYLTMKGLPQFVKMLLSSWRNWLQRYMNYLNLGLLRSIEAASKQTGLLKCSKQTGDIKVSSL